MTRPRPVLVTAAALVSTALTATAPAQVARCFGAFFEVRRYALSGNNRAIAIGDLDLDGIDDAVFATSESVEVYRSLGDGEFELTQTLDETAVVSNDVGDAGLRDVTGDGLPDLALVIGGETDALGVWPGLGDGTFGAPFFRYVNSRFGTILFGDVGADGHEDIVGAGTGESSGTIRVFPSDGQGGILPAIVRTIPARLESPRLADLDQDGRADFVYAGDEEIVVIPGAPDGYLSKQTIRTPIQFNGAAVDLDTIELVHLDNDGILDIVAAGTRFGSQTDPLFLMLGVGDGTFMPWRAYEFTSLAGMLVGDFNADGTLDVAIDNGQNGADVTMLRGLGDGLLEPAGDHIVGMTPTNSRVADLDADGVDDLIVTQGIDFMLFRGGGDRLLRTPDRYDVNGDNPIAIDVADFNADGNLDCVTANRLSGSLSVLLGLGDGSFGPPTILAAGGDPRAVVAIDLNDDTHIDLACVNAEDDTVSVFFGMGDGAFSPPAVRAVGDNPYDLAAGDMNGDSRPDLAVSHADGEEVRVLFNDGSPDFPSESVIPLTGRGLIVELEDIDDDEDLDLIVLRASPDSAIIYRNVGDATFLPNTIQFPTGPPAGLALGDLQQDGLPDLVISRLNPTTLFLAINQGDGVVNPGFTLLPGSNPGPVVVADFDADGDQDIVAESLGSTALVVLLGRSGFTFSDPLRYSSGSLSLASVAADLNNDGRPDLVSTDTATDSVIVHLNGCVTCPADLGPPFGELDFTDVTTFLVAFGAGLPLADLAEPVGVLNFSDVLAFLTAFDAGCP